MKEERREIFGKQLLVLHIHKHVHSEVKPDKGVLRAEFVSFGVKFLEVAHYVLFKLCIFGQIKVGAAVKDGVILTSLGYVLLVDKLTALGADIRRES